MFYILYSHNIKDSFMLYNVIYVYIDSAAMNDAWNVIKKIRFYLKKAILEKQSFAVINCLHTYYIPSYLQIFWDSMFI